MLIIWKSLKQIWLNMTKDKEKDLLFGDLS
jgi:hypothetical protein